MEKIYHKLKTALKKYKNILIVIKGSPDPDAIASSFVLQKICNKLDIKSEIIAQKEISLSINKEFTEELKIPITFVNDIKEKDDFNAYAILDYQDVFIKELSPKMPCVLHIDHHEPIETSIVIDLNIIQEDVGSVCSIMTFILMESDLEFDDDEMRSISTSLIYGIYIDTNEYEHASELDYKALNYLSKFSDNSTISHFTNTPLSKDTVNVIWNAIENLTVYKDWLISGVGYIDSSHRDSIAIAADFLLKREDVPTVIVFAAVEDKEKQTLILDASFRSTMSNLNLNDIIKEITSEGGARKYKGAYQIEMDYFIHCPDKELLWEVINMTTIDVLKNRRDGIYITELKGFYKKFRARINNFFIK